MKIIELVGAKFFGQVRDISTEGLGVIDHPSTKVFFSLGVFPGDEGDFEIIKVKKKYGVAKLIKLSKASPLRITPPCEHQGLELGQCGGCPWMSISYSTQIQFKTAILRQLLLRHKLIEAEYPLQFLASPKQFGFRKT
jgi:23S rRNA (uracil1939-C5)-methyltransferase